ncbi:MAG: NUDIX domain-containing protein [Propionibacteriaceae bacterium]|nr:NUDIX domain-containing protein [Propionibacteriaceae bacterium]
MAHIHTEPGQYDLTASAYIVRTSAPEPAILLHKHKTLGWIMQPGGHVELNETPWQAICHEIREETGYDMDQLQVLQPPLRLPTALGVDRHPQPLSISSFQFSDIDHFHTDITFVFTTDQNPRHNPGEDESPVLLWLTRQDLVDLDPTQTHEEILATALFILDTVLHQWEPIHAS